MDKARALQHIEKYKSISQSLGLKSDEDVWDEITDFISSSINVKSSNGSTNGLKKGKYGESDFHTITSNENIDLSTYGIDEKILSHKDDILDFWHSLDSEQRNGFTIFELNIILFLISPHYNKYQKKEKKRILSLVDSAVKDKRLNSSYDKIIV